MSKKCCTSEEALVKETSVYLPADTSTLSQSLEIDYLLEKRCGTRSILFYYYNWVLLEAVDLRREVQHQLLLSTFSTPMRLWGYILFF
jgi:hypothetical protein